MVPKSVYEDMPQRPSSSNEYGAGGRGRRPAKVIEGSNTYAIACLQKDACSWHRAAALGQSYSIVICFLELSAFEVQCISEKLGAVFVFGHSHSYPLCET